MSKRRDLSGAVKSFSSMQKHMTESETSEEELSISSDPRRDSSEVERSPQHRSKQQQSYGTSDAPAQRKDKKRTTDEEIAQRYSNALEEEQKLQNKRARRVVTPLSSTQLITGLVKIMHDFPTTTAQCQKGKEAAYAANLIKTYKAFCHELIPNASFLDAIAKIDSLGGKKDVKLCLQHMRDQHRDSVLGKILGQSTREKILQEKNGIRNDIDGKPTVESHRMNQEGEKDDDDENEANLADVTDVTQRADEQHPNIEETGKKVDNDWGNDSDNEEKENEAVFGETEITSLRIKRRVLHDSDTEEEEMTFDGITEVSEGNRASTSLLHEAVQFECSSVEQADSEKKLDSHAYNLHVEGNESGGMESTRNSPAEVGEQVQWTSAADSSSDRPLEKMVASSEHNVLNNDEQVNHDNRDHKINNNRHITSSTSVEHNEAASTKTYYSNNSNSIKAGIEENYTQSSMIIQDNILEDSEALVFDGTQSSIPVGVNNSVESIFILAQTQSQSDTVMFSSEEVPTQLASQLEAENCFTELAVVSNNRNSDTTVEETPTQLMDSQEEMVVDHELMEDHPNSESPTQIINSQFYATENY